MDEAGSDEAAEDAARAPDRDVESFPERASARGKLAGGHTL
jgi:hypothetical protein